MYEANNARERFLTAQETPRLRLALKHSENSQLQFIVPLLLLTGARKRKLLEAKWDHFDLERRTWRIPTSKTGKARHVPLSAAVLSVLAQVLGHTQIKTASRYSHPSKATLLDAVDAAANATGTNWSPAQAAKTGENLGARL